MRPSSAKPFVSQGSVLGHIQAVAIYPSENKFCCSVPTVGRSSIPRRSLRRVQHSAFASVIGITNKQLRFRIACVCQGQKISVNSSGSSLSEKRGSDQCRRRGRHEHGREDNRVGEPLQVPFHGVFQSRQKNSTDSPFLLLLAREFGKCGSWRTESATRGVAAGPSSAPLIASASPLRLFAVDRSCQIWHICRGHRTCKPEN